MIHTLLYNLVAIPADGSDLNQWKCPLVCWLAVSGLRDGGRFMPAYDYTRVLAKWEYQLRNLHLYQAIQRATEYEDNLLGSVRHQCSTYLVDGSMTPWNSLRDHQRYASSLVLRQAAPAKIDWSDDMSKISCLGTTLELSRLRTGLQKICSSVESRMEKLCNGNLLPISVPADLTEDLTDIRPGFSWLKQGPFMEPKLGLLEVLFTHPDYSLATVDQFGVFRWKHQGLRKLRGDIAALTEELAVLCFMTPAPPPRGTEFVDTRLSNAQIPRNVHKSFGTWFIHQRTKTSSLTESLSWVPTLCPDLRITSAHMGVGLSLHIWRHIAVSLMREFIPPTSIQDNFGDKTMNHNTNMARRIYAREVGHLPSLTTDAMLESRRFCEMWHDVLGVGKSPCPVPLRATNYQQHAHLTGNHPAAPAAPAVDVAQLTALVSASVNTSFEALKVHLEDLIQKAVVNGVSVAMRSLSQEGPPLRQPPVPQFTPRPRPYSPGLPDSSASKPANTSELTYSVDQRDPFKPSSDEEQETQGSMEVDSQPLSSAPSYLQYSTPVHYDAPNPMSIARDLLRQGLNNPHASFISHAQYELVACSLARDRNVIGILPTGGGKSMCYELPALLYQDQLSIVFVPFVSLIQDQIRRASERGVKAAKFSQSSDPAKDLQILFVSWEHAADRRLQNFIQSNEQRIHRLVIDEAHQILTAGGQFRPKLKQIDVLRTVSLPKIYLSATISPDHHQKDFIESIGMNAGSVKVIRAPTGRRELQYHQYKFQKADHILAFVHRFTYQSYLTGIVRSDSRVIIFCRQVADAETISKSLGCLKYYGSLGQDERTETQTKWMAGATSAHRCIAATSAFVHGIDAPYVDLIIF
ncbi:uncharacterized protein C8Q71DRAFT_713220, partial [Rhodofomes roseus]